MRPSDAEYAAAIVARRVGLPVEAQLIGSDRLTLTPTGIHANDGFSVAIRTTWRTAEVQFVPGRFARPLIEKMGEAGAAARTAFCALAAAALKHGKLTFRVNGSALDAVDASAWPPHWQSVELILKKQGIVFEDLNVNELKRLLADIVSPIFGMCIALIGVDDVETDDSALEGDPVERVSQRYERKAINREICLSVRGRRCFCCNFDFGEAYGSSADGYIEVHHIVPAAGMGPGYQVNPVTDLVPICSNCHSVVHMTNPPASVDDVRALVQRQRGER
jgi:5-methylcytosine-specific restriction enzyme A